MKSFISTFSFFLFGALQEDWSNKSADEKAGHISALLFVVPVFTWMFWGGRQNILNIRNDILNGRLECYILGISLYTLLMILFKKYIKKKLT